MDAIERLSLEEAGTPTLLALTHVHRYEVAAGFCDGMRVLDLCCGSGYGARILSETAASVTGIDNHGPSIERARETVADRGGIAFERGDAHEYLDRDLADQFDAVVLLEGLEHLPDPAHAIEQLRRHAEAGLTLIVSLPNSKPFGEENPHHVAEFDFEGAMAAFARLPRARVLYQFHAEGSLIRPPEGSELNGRVSLADRAEGAHCNHFLAIVNAKASLPSSTRMELTVAPSFNRYMLDLERENRKLWRANQRIARDKLGVTDSAAAAALRRRHHKAELPRPLEPVAAVGAGLLKALWTILLNILPHGLTLLLLRIRARLREG